MAEAQEGLSEESSFEHILFETSSFFNEMFVKMNALKRNMPKSNFTLFFNNENESYETASLVSSRKGKFNNPAARNLIDKMCKLDEKILENENMFQKLKEGRKYVQEEMYNIILSSEISPSHSKCSQLFLQLCNFEKSTSEKCDKDEDEKDKVKSSDQQTKPKKKTDRSDKNFIARNIQLAKQRLLMQYSLTDEEKIHLESLLSDIDSEKYSLHDRHKSQTMSKRSLKKFSPRKVCRENYFKFKEDELAIMEDLDNKIKDMGKLNTSENNEINNSTHEMPVLNCEDALAEVEQGGRYWKHNHLQQRLQNIDKDLADIAAKDAEEKERFEKQNQQIPFLYDVIRNKEDENVNTEDEDDKF